MGAIDAILKSERIKEFEKMLDSLDMIRDLMSVTIDKYKARIAEIEAEEIHETHVIKNCTETSLLVDFSNKTDSRPTYVVIEDYIYKSSLTKEQLESTQIKALYRQKKIEDIKVEEMEYEKNIKKPGSTGPTSIPGVANIGVTIAGRSLDRNVLDAMIQKNTNNREPSRDKSPEVKRMDEKNFSGNSCEVLSQDDINEILGKSKKVVEEIKVTLKPKKTTKKRTPAKKKPAKKKAVKKRIYAKKNPTRKKNVR